MAEARTPDPGTGLPATKVETREQRVVRRDDSTGCTRVGHHQRRDGATRRGPIDRRGKHPTKSGLDVESTERLLEIADRGLDLDNQQRPSRPMKSENIDASAIAVVIEAHLNARFPPCGGEKRHGLLHELCVRRVDQPVEVGSVPSNGDVDGRAEGHDNATQGADRHRLHGPALDARQDLARHAGTRGEVGLAPAAMATEVPYRSWQIGSHNHCTMIATSHYSPVTSYDSAGDL